MKCVKHPHASMGAAAAHLRALQKREAEPVARYAYFCFECRAYHVGRRKKKAHDNKYGGRR